MVPEVDDVVADDEFQRQFASIGPAPDVWKSVRVDVADQRNQVVVGRLPQVYDLAPGLILVALQADPVVLFVPRQIDGRIELQADKSLMIIRGRIDQVSEDLFFRPLAGRWTF